MMTTMPPSPPETDGEAAQEKEPKRAKKARNRESWGKTLLRVLASLLVIVLGVWLVLYLVARAAAYPTVLAMLADMWAALQLAWQRIIS